MDKILAGGKDLVQQVMAVMVHGAVAGQGGGAVQPANSAVKRSIGFTIGFHNQKTKDYAIRHYANQSVIYDFCVGVPISRP